MPFSAPIMNPKNPSVVWGEISVISDITGTSQSLQIVLDLTAAMGSLAPTAGFMPNGTLIPIAGLNASNWLVIPVGGGKGDIYVNINPSAKSAVLGASFSIAAMKASFPVDLFMSFNVNSIPGLAGLYTGMGKGQSGFAVFVSASSIFR